MNVNFAVLKRNWFMSKM